MVKKLKKRVVLNFTLLLFIFTLSVLPHCSEDNSSSTTDTSSLNKLDILLNLEPIVNRSDILSRSDIVNRSDVIIAYGDEFIGRSDAVTIDEVPYIMIPTPIDPPRSYYETPVFQFAALSNDGMRLSDATVYNSEFRFSESLPDGDYAFGLIGRSDIVGQGDFLASSALIIKEFKNKIKQELGDEYILIAEFPPPIHLAEYTQEKMSIEITSLGTADNPLGTLVFRNAAGDVFIPPASDATFSWSNLNQFEVIDEGQPSPSPSPWGEVEIEVKAFLGDSADPNFNKWNYYVNTTDVTKTCDPDNDTDCTHAGDKRIIDVSDYILSCENVELTGSLTALSWSCYDNCEALQGVYTGFSCSGLNFPSFVSSLKNDGKLSDLIDNSISNNPAWEKDSLTLDENGSSINLTSSQIYWTNTLAALVDDGSDSGFDLTQSGGLAIVLFEEYKIYVISGIENINTTGIVLAATGQALVVMPDAGLKFTGIVDNVSVEGVGTATIVILAISHNFIWFEGDIDGNLIADFGVHLYHTKFSTIRNSNSSNSSIGVKLDGSDNSKLTNVFVAGNASTGIVLSESYLNVLTGIAASENGHHGVSLSYNSNENELTDVTTSDNLQNGINLSESSSYNVLSNIIASNNFQGVSLNSNSNNNELNAIDASNNEDVGIWLDISSYNMLTNITAFNNGTNDISIFTESMENSFLGYLYLDYNDAKRCNFVWDNSNTAGDDGSIQGSDICECDINTCVAPDCSFSVMGSITSCSFASPTNFTITLFL